MVAYLLLLALYTLLTAATSSHRTARSSGVAASLLNQLQGPSKKQIDVLSKYSK